MKKFLLLYQGPATPPDASHEQGVRHSSVRLIKNGTLRWGFKLKGRAFCLDLDQQNSLRLRPCLVKLLKGLKSQ